MSLVVLPTSLSFTTGAAGGHSPLTSGDHVLCVVDGTKLLPDR
jgi:hypothetical protein